MKRITAAALSILIAALSWGPAAHQAFAGVLARGAVRSAGVAPVRPAAVQAPAQPLLSALPAGLSLGLPASVGVVPSAAIPGVAVPSAPGVSLETPGATASPRRGSRSVGWQKPSRPTERAGSRTRNNASGSLLGTSDNRAASGPQGGPRGLGVSKETPSGKRKAKTLETLKSAAGTPGEGRESAEPAAAALFDGGPNPLPAVLGAYGVPGDGARKAVLIVGAKASYGFYLAEARKEADARGLELYLLDEAAHFEEFAKEHVPASHFIPVPEGMPLAQHHDEPLMDRIAEAAARTLAERGIRIDAVASFIGSFPLVAGKIADRLGASGNSYEAVKGTFEKARFREFLAREFPEYNAESRVVRSPEEAAAAFVEFGGGKAVIKPVQGAGGQGVVTDVDSPEKAAAVYREVDEYLKEFAKSDEAAFFGMEKHPGIIIERQLEGLEVDVEVVRSGTGEIFTEVSYNPPTDKPYAVEKAVTFGPVVPEPIRAAIEEAARRVSAKLGVVGNSHAELIFTRDGPRFLEYNAGRPGGGMGLVYDGVLAASGVNVVRAGLSAAAGLRLELPAARPATVVESRMIIPAATGVIESIEGLEALKEMPGFHMLRAWKKAGQAVKAPGEDAFSYIGYAAFTGATYEEAVDRALKALESVRVRIRRSDGAVAEQTAAYSHRAESADDVLVDHGVETPESNARRERVLGSYLRGQYAFIAIYTLYYGLFAPVAMVLAGDFGVGWGRIGYAGAVALFGPIAGVIVSRIPTRSVLIRAMAARAAIWSALLPLAWLLLGANPAMGAIFLAFMFLDGLVVSMNTIADIDEAGMDLLARQHRFVMTDAVRNRYNSVFEGALSFGQFLIPLAMATLGVTMTGLMSGSAALVAVMALGVGLPALAGVYYYRRIPKRARMDFKAKSLKEDLLGVGAELKDGLKRAIANKRIRWRILFYTLEKALRDSMILVVLATFGMKVLAPGSAAWGAFASTALVSAGMLGAVAASWLMHRLWKAPQPGESRYRAYRVFFPLTFAAGIAALGLPLAASLVLGGSFWAGAALAGAASFLFFLPLVAAEIGFRNLMQGIMAEEKLGGRLFGVMHTSVMGVNLVAVAALSAIFAVSGVELAMWQAAALFAGLTLLEAVLGPRLLFTKQERAARN